MDVGVGTVFDSPTVKENTLSAPLKRITMESPRPMPTYPPVQSVMRAFRLLANLSRREAASLSELNHLTRLPKPSLVRLLNTLIGLGYVRNDRTRKTYSVTPAVQELSEGFHGGALLVEAGQTQCVALTRKLKWSASLAVLDGAEMFICFRTIHDSPVSPFSTMLTRRRNLLTTGLGRAYLGFCAEDERRWLTNMLKTANDDELHGQDIDTMIDAIVAQAARGYTERDPLATPDSTSTVAMPVRHGDRVLGTVGVTYFTSAIARRDLPRAVITPLRDAVSSIEAAAARLIAQKRSHDTLPAYSRRPRRYRSH